MKFVSTLVKFQPAFVLPWCYMLLRA